MLFRSFPKSMRPPKPNSVEPPWYGTRMPGGVGGVASRGVPLSRSIPAESTGQEKAPAVGHTPVTEFGLFVASAFLLTPITQSLFLPAVIREQ